VDQHTARDFLPVRDEGHLRLALKIFEILQQQLTSKDYGTYLGQALCCDRVRDAFGSAESRSTEPLCCLLCIAASELKTLRWEQLCAPLDGLWDFLTQSQRVPFFFGVGDRLWAPRLEAQLPDQPLFSSPLPVPHGPVAGWVGHRRRA